MNLILTRGPRLRAMLGMAAVLAVLMTALSLAGGRDAEAAYKYQTQFEWRISGGPGVVDVQPGARYWLFNNNNEQYLKYSSQTYGINLAFKPYFEPKNIAFVRQSGSGSLKYGELLAIYVDGGGYLKYGSRTWGINLVWSASPVYEWRFDPRDKNAGAVINPYDFYMGLYNTTARAPLALGNQNYGVGLVWSPYPLPTTASLYLRYEYPLPANHPYCNLPVSWTAYPVSLTGSTGISTPVSTNPLGTGGPVYDLCNAYGTFSSLKVGTWRIEVVGVDFRTSCQVFLGREYNSTLFGRGTNGCAYAHNP